MAQLSFAAVTGTGMDDIEFVNGKYIYLPYQKVTADNVESYIDKSE